MNASSGFLAGAILLSSLAVFSADLPRPDLVVAGDGSGDFKTVQAAVESIPRNNRERTVIFVKDGVYREKVRVNAPLVTLRGQSRNGTRIEFTQLEDEFAKAPDPLGRAVMNVNKANDFVLENLTVANTATDVVAHAFAVYGTGDRTVFLDCNLLSDGGDTVALWGAGNGRYYHARCSFRGGGDYVCPRGSCYITDSTFYGTKKGGSALWHDGHVAQDLKLVVRNSRFDGVEGWCLGRHQVDAQFYVLNCSFARTMSEKALLRVRYAGDEKKNAEIDKAILWGERIYYYHCRRDGGDLAWYRDNLATAPGSLGPDQITAAWAFDGKWDPERKTGPKVQNVNNMKGLVSLAFDESVTVKGKPRLALEGGGFAEYASGSGNRNLVFTMPPDSQSDPKALDLNGGAIIACEAAATLRMAELALPARVASKER